jgi:SAM-dependent methyltransferase
MTATDRSTVRDEMLVRNEMPRGEPNLTGSKTTNFNRLARLYRWMEYASFGPWLWWCRCAFAGELNGSRHGAILGDGDGRFTARLLAANPQIKIDAVDASHAMLRLLARRAGPNADRVHAHCADVRAWRPRTGEYDLIATHFFLDCLTTDEVRELAKKMRAAAAPGARWVVSEFAEPANWYGRSIARPIVRLLYEAFGVLTGLRVRALPDYRQALREAGFALEKRRAWLGGLLVSELWRAQPGADA